MNYEDERIKRLEAEKQGKVTNVNSTYEQMLADNQAMLDKNNSWQDEYLRNQQDLLDQGTNLITNQLQQKQRDADNSYKREAMSSEADYQKFINPYGVQAEKMAAAGLSGAEGYSESTKSRAYTTSRMRTAQALANKNKIIAEYDNAIAEAKLNNDSQKATIALDLLKQKLANEMNALQISLGLKQNQMDYQTNIDNTYYNRYQDVFNQQNYEREQAEALRQYQEQLAYQKERDRVLDSQWQKQYNLSAQKAAEQKQQEIDLYNAKSNTPISHIARELINYGSDGKLNKNAIINSVNSYYQKGQLTKEEVNYIFDQLGIE